MAISHELKTIFIHIAKNAGTSISTALGIYNKKSFVNHLGYDFYMNKFQKEWNDYYKFAIVRNPFDRIVSSYLFAKKDISYMHSSIPEIKCKRSLEFPEFKSEPHIDYLLLKNKSFDETVELFYKNPKLFKHPSWRNQWNFIMNNKKELMIDDYFKIENIEYNWNIICKKININIELPIKNKTNSKKVDYKNFYTDKLKNMVYEIYKNDIELFKYEF